MTTENVCGEKGLSYVVYFVADRFSRACIVCWLMVGECFAIPLSQLNDIAVLSGSIFVYEFVHSSA